MSLPACVNHEQRQGVYLCSICRARICDECLLLLWGRKLCPSCVIGHYDRLRPRYPTAWGLLRATLAGLLTAAAVLTSQHLVPFESLLAMNAHLLGLIGTLFILAYAMACGAAVRVAAWGQASPLFRFAAAGCAALGPLLQPVELQGLVLLLLSSVMIAWHVPRMRHPA